ncbi:MAG: hypothetical protein IKA54_02170 [Clostridia bacterium]|nr:hypothetical protein [Clostridia bacterium]
MYKKLGLNGNALKIIACISMLIDHVGLMLLPNEIWLRCIGRVAFLIFAFLISEGCYYTKNKLRYFLSVFTLGVICQIGFDLVYKNQVYLGILLTFSLSIILIYLLEQCKTVFIKKSKLYLKILAPVLLFLSILGCYYVTEKIAFDYGFMGIMLPFICSLFDFDGKYNLRLKKLLFVIGAIIYFVQSDLKEIIVYSLLSIPLVLLYNGKRGSKKLKYFFYAFYPVHILIIAGLTLVI